MRVELNDPSGALRSLDFDALREALRDYADIVGVADLQELKVHDAWAEALRRASTDLLSWPSTLPAGEEFVRPELSALFSRLDARSSTSVLTGEPGAGKSALLATLGNKLTRKGWPVLAIKADLLPSSVESEEQLQQALGLPDEPNRLIRSIAKFRPVALLIDQLDALASYVDVRTGRLSVLLNLIRRVGDLDNVHIVLSSRVFEFNHDVRLRSVAAEQVPLELPPWSDVLKILEGHDVNASGWPPDAQAVLRSPQALNLYLRLSDGERGEAFNSYHAMLDRLWEQRVASGPDGAKRSAIVYAIANDMAEHETLWLARARFDEQSTEVTSLIAAGVLATFGREGSIGFSHQTLFEYALARSFSRSRGQLSAYVLSRQASLFVRPKLWAGLTYLRGVELAAYENEIEALWETSDLRRHLRLLLIEFLGHQQLPSDRETILMTTAFQRSENIPKALGAIAGSRGWFERLAHNCIARAMSTPEQTRVVEVLRAALVFAPNAALQLIKEHWLPNPDNDAKAWLVIEDHSSWSEEALEVAKTIIARTQVAPFRVDHLVGLIGVDQPDVALEVVRAFLECELRNAGQKARGAAGEAPPADASDDELVLWHLRNDPKDPFEAVLDKSRDWGHLVALAERAPAKYLGILWPTYLELLRAMDAVDPGNPALSYRLPYVADFRFDGESSLDLEPGPILEAVVTAIDALDDDSFTQWARQQTDEPLMPVQRLIAHGYAVHAETLSSEALSFLLGDARRFHLGSHEDLSGTTKALVRVASERWTEHEVRRFESAVWDYDPPMPDTYKDATERRRWKHLVRRIKLDLLRALPRKRASAAVRRRIEEEGRIFPDAKLGARYSGVHVVGSIMEAASISRASDADILNAFRQLPDATGWTHPIDWNRGGNIQLAREFATFAKAEPGRALRLMDQFDADFGSRAAGYAIDAMADEGDPQQVTNLLVKLVARGFENEEFRTSTARAMEKLAARDVAVSDDIVRILEGWLASSDLTKSHSHERTPERGSGSDSEEEDVSARSLLWGHGGFSLLPGGDYSVLEALIQTRLARGEREKLQEALALLLEQTRERELWHGLLRYLPQVGNRDERHAAFMAEVLSRCPDLTGSRDLAHVLAHMHWWAPDVVGQEVDRWKNHAKRSARQTFGELVTLVALMQPKVAWAQEGLDELTRDDAMADARVGSALTAVNLWPEHKTRRVCTQILVELLSREEEGVWNAAFDVFRLVDELTPDRSTVDLLTAMADRLPSAGKVDPTFVVERLQTLLPHEASLVASFATGLVAICCDDLGDLRTSAAMAAEPLVDLAITLHRLGPRTREAGTLLFERLIDADVYGARATLDEIDRRFRSARSPAPRLPRRRRRRTRRTAN